MAIKPKNALVQFSTSSFVTPFQYNNNNVFAQVIAIYNEHKDKLENDLEEISTALTCIVSIKDYHEERISQADFKDIPKGLEELEEVNRNISERIHPAENHIVFETNHGVDR